MIPNEPSPMDELYTRIDEILFYQWDPLRISRANWARDEYSSYVDETFRLATQGDSPQPIADYLHQMATKWMGMESQPQRDRDIAELIYALAQDQNHFPDQQTVEVD